jgi:hypothetical protein
MVKIHFIKNHDRQAVRGERLSTAARPAADRADRQFTFSPPTGQYEVQYCEMC